MRSEKEIREELKCFGDQSQCGTERWEGCPLQEACDIEVDKKARMKRAKHLVYKHKFTGPWSWVLEDSDK